MTRLIVAGGGLIGARHIEHIAAHPDMTLTGVIDPDPAVTAPPGTPVFGDIDAVDIDADGIVIAAPTQLHDSLFAAATRRGWHALIEKPIAHDLDAADRMIALADATGTRVLTGHHRRFHPKVTALKALLPHIGQPVLASAIWAVRKHDTYFDTGWRKGIDGAPVRMNVSHEIDLLRHLFGEVRDVAGLGGNPVRKTARVESGGAVLRFDSGLTATIAFADTTPSPWGFEHGTGENPNIAHTGQDSLRIMGTTGSLEFPSLRLWSGARDWSQAPVPTPNSAPDGTPLVAQLEHFADVIAGRAVPLNDARSGRRTLEVTLQVEAATVPERAP